MAQDLEQLLERRAKLQEQIDEVETKILEQKKSRRDELLAELKELGFDGPAPRRTPASGVRQRDPNRPCPICQIAGHDKRAHRSHPKAFTPAELKERNLPSS